MGYLAASFIVVWILVTFYLLFMGVRQRQLEQEISTLSAIAKRQDGDE